MSLTPESKIALLECKKNAVFARLQSIYELTKRVSDKEILKQLLLKARSIEILRIEFSKHLDEFNECQMLVDATYIPNFSPMDAFDDMYCTILAVVSAAEKSSTKPAPVKPPCEVQPKLPKVRLPDFDGRPENWPVFFQLFKRLIHDNTTLSKVEKVNFLIAHLQGPAKKVCCGLLPTDENYEIILETLKDRFEDKRALAATYLDKILNFKPLNYESDKGLDLFIEHVIETINALKQLNISDLADFMLVQIALKRLDSETSKSFEMSTRKETIPKLNDLIKFVREQAKILHRIKKPTPSSGKSNPIGFNKNTHSFVSQRLSKKSLDNKSYDNSNSLSPCILCKNLKHQFYRCDTFLKKSVSERWTFAKSNKICFNCLSYSSHQISSCKSKHSCAICKRKHHSLLHFDSLSSNETTAPPDPTAMKSNNSTASDECKTSNSPVVHCSTSTSDCSATSMVLLATARISIKDEKGRTHVLRALIDPGSQSHFITKSACERVGIKLDKMYSEVKGIGLHPLTTRFCASFKFTSANIHTAPHYDVSALVVDKLAESLPALSVNHRELTYLHKLTLADNEYYKPGKVDVLLGAELWPLIMGNRKIMDLPCNPAAFETSLGFVIMGKAPICNVSPTINAFCTTVNTSLEDIVPQFWKLEEVPTTPIISAEDANCEKTFLSTVLREADGKFTVGLPFKLPPSKLGVSKETSIVRYLALEKRLLRNTDLHEAYKTIFKEYLENHWISMVGEIHHVADDGYYLPYHGVVKTESTSTPLRIVYNASSPSSTCFSLNDLLYVGPKLQTNIMDLLLNFRLFPYVVSADVKKMYLQIWMNEEHRKYQRIIWRPSSEANLQVYQLNTVCFGVSSSPYLAQRVIRLLADLEKNKFPLAASIIPRDIYVDDIVSSVQTEKEAMKLHQQLIGLFGSGGFLLSKWSTNSPLLKNLLTEDMKPVMKLDLDVSAYAKVLGAQWNLNDDTLSFQVTLSEEKCTKRHMLSLLARIFDPLGLVAPVTVYAKLLIKKLWDLKVSWDETPPASLTDQWEEFKKELALLSTIRIPRHTSIQSGIFSSLFGFCDASESAYGAVIYIRSDTSDSKLIRLLCAKSRVAPSKYVSLPRLELCAALLLSKLTRHVIDAYIHRFSFHRFHLFTDSTVVLHWINSFSSKWKVFVANRIAQIQEATEATWWNHVPGSENPADCLSRGLKASAFIQHPLWFTGPSWITNDRLLEATHKIPDIETDHIAAEAKPTYSLTSRFSTHILESLLQKTSTYNRLLRITAYLLRFTKRMPKSSLIIQPDELIDCENFWIRITQKKHFETTYDKLKLGKQCPKELKFLDLFIHNGIIRIGGRLDKANLSFEHRHPCLLPKKDKFVDLLIHHYHVSNLHTGPSLVLSLLRAKFWILAGRGVVRNVIHKCITCFRTNPKSVMPKMAPLPTIRLQEAPAFTYSGTDYAGPFHITLSRRRGVRSQKAYICIFVCLTVKAIHLELASDLSTNSFLMAFRRFIARRGPCKVLMSDNGTNFIGARRVLDEFHELLHSEDFNSAVSQELSTKGIEWRLIPPSAPHFGGIWESNIKVVKSHLRRVIGKQILTHEEFYTILTQIEALLNSRPLCRISEDPSERILTPAHFLTLGSTLMHLPASNVEQIPKSLNQRYSLINQIINDFWKRWKQDYLHTLQERTKWLSESTPVVKGTLVLLKNNNAPPLEWPLGRIEEVFPGADGIIRVVTVKTSQGIFKRPVHKLCPLPREDAS